MRYFMQPHMNKDVTSIDDDHAAIPAWEDAIRKGNAIEIADAQDTPLNAGPGNVGQPAVKSLFGTTMTWWYCATCMTQKEAQGDPRLKCATIPEVKPVDPAEQKLLDKVLPKFNGEAPCQPPKPSQGYPREPYFHNNPERNAQSERVVRRFLTINMREWATCRFTREPLELRFEGAAMKDDPYGGEFVKPVFFCPYCGVYGS